MSGSPRQAAPSGWGCPPPAQSPSVCCCCCCSTLLLFSSLLPSSPLLFRLLHTAIFGALNKPYSTHFSALIISPSHSHPHPSTPSPPLFSSLLRLSASLSPRRKQDRRGSSCRCCQHIGTWIGSRTPHRYSLADPSSIRILTWAARKAKRQCLRKAVPSPLSRVESVNTQGQGTVSTA